MSLELLAEMQHLNLHITQQQVHTLMVHPTIEDKICRARSEDEGIPEVKKNLGLDKAPGFRIDPRGTVLYKDRLCVPNRSWMNPTTLPILFILDVPRCSQI